MINVGTIKHAKLISVILTLLFTSNAALSSAAGFDTELHHRILNATEADNPYLSRDTIMFSYQAPRGTQAVSLAFEHENYRQFHTYKKNQYGIFILTLPVPGNQRELRYRLIVDGLWTADPMSRIVRDEHGIRVSTYQLPSRSGKPQAGVTRNPDGSTSFVFYGPDAADVFLVGDFNRWDPYVTQMPESEIYPGVYEARLRIPRESRYYRLVVNGQDILDPANQKTARNGWGEDASRIQ